MTQLHELTTIQWLPVAVCVPSPLDGRNTWQPLMPDGQYGVVLMGREHGTVLTAQRRDQGRFVMVAKLVRGEK